MNNPSDQHEAEKKKWEVEKLNWKVNPDDFENTDEKPIASGGQGCVFLMKWIPENKYCVMKRIRSSINDVNVKRYFNREIQILSTYRHPAIVPFIGYDERKVKRKTFGFIYLLMIEKGTLFHNITVNSKEGEKDLLWDNTHKFIITFGIACAMEYLHNHNIIHRDLKSENILLDSNLYPYVTDFGTAKDILIGNSIHQTIQGATAYIMAPEFLKETDKYKNSLPLDVYAFGITLYHLWTGIFPFSNFSDFTITQEVMKGNRPQIPNGISENIKELIESCWSQNFEDRPTFAQIVDVLLSPAFSNENQNPKFLEYKKLIDPFRPNYDQNSSVKSIANEQQLVDLQIQNLSNNYPSTKDDYNSFESPVLKSLLDDTKSGNLTSELDLAIALNNGTYGPVDKEAASEHFFKVANKSNNSSEQGLAEYYYGLSKIEKKDYTNAESFLRRSRRHGNADAAYKLTELINSGKIKGKNSDDYFSLLEMAAKNGIKEAAKKLVTLLLDPKFSRHSKKMAYYYIKLGSDLGDHEMMHKYSKILEYGMGCVEKNVCEAINLLNMLSDFNYVPAQIDLALHLLNGQNILKNPDRAESILEISISSNDPYAMLWYSTIIANDEERLEGSNHYFELSLESCQAPEAWAIYGQKLIESGQYENALDPLYYGMQLGSINAFLSFGNICEINPQYGDPSIYFKCAADRCHSLDECGFYFPLNFKVFHCVDCDIDICEGCAKSCHKSHNIKFLTISLGCDFKCKCGASGFGTNSIPCCTAKSISSLDDIQQGINCFNQHLYQCETCCTNTDKCFICKSCIKNCHKNHRIIDCGVQNGVCSCGTKNIPNNFKCTLIDQNSPKEVKNDCTMAYYADEKIYQKWFHCFTCNISGSKDVGVCAGCASTCHAGHRCVFLGFNKFCCGCLNQGNCSFIG